MKINWHRPSVDVLFGDEGILEVDQHPSDPNGRVDADHQLRYEEGYADPLEIKWVNIRAHTSWILKISIGFSHSQSSSHIGSRIFIQIANLFIALNTTVNWLITFVKQRRTWIELESDTMQDFRGMM